MAHLTPTVPVTQDHGITHILRIHHCSCNQVCRSTKADRHPKDQVLQRGLQCTALATQAIRLRTLSHDRATPCRVHRLMSYCPNTSALHSQDANTPHATPRRRCQARRASPQQEHSMAVGLDTQRHQGSCDSYPPRPGLRRRRDGRFPCLPVEPLRADPVAFAAVRAGTPELSTGADAGIMAGAGLLSLCLTRLQ